MKFSLSWLKEYIPTQLSANKIAIILTSAGLEVDGVEETKTPPKNQDSVTKPTSATDSIFEVSLTPNLGHCSSMIGVARELSAAKLGTVNIPKISFHENSEAVDSTVKVSIADSVRCSRYACRVVKNVKIEPSPEWMQQRLVSAGIRPINNVVDITNYVALEAGQPLHAFDYDLLQGKELLIRTAFEGEMITTIDCQLRQLTTEDLLICDNGQTPFQSRPIALAGIMGGLDTEVSESTVNVLIESANFHPGAIRRTSRRLGLSTDASKRFERNVDPNGVIWALDRAAMLMEQIAKGEVFKVVDLKNSDFPKRKVICRLSRVNQLIGITISSGEMEDIFDRLEFIHQWDGKDCFELQIPTYRADISEEIDIIEEIARIYGYDNIPAVQPKYHGSELPHAVMYLFEKEVRSQMLSNKLQEFLTCDLIGPTLLNIVKVQSMAAEATIQVLNPTSIEQSILRTSLLPGLLQLVKYNQDHQNSNLTGFEIGRIHFKSNGNYKEQSMLGIVMAGDASPVHWKRKSLKLDFFDLKGLIESFLSGIGITNPTFKVSSLATFHPGRQLTIYIGELKVGAFGEVHPAIVKRLDVPERILFAEINLHDLYMMRKPEEKVSDLPLFPSSERDWTITLSTEMPIVEVLDKIQSISSELLEEVTLIDIYESDKLGKNLRNATFHFIYRDKQKTIAQATVDAEHKRIIDGAIQNGLRPL